MVGEKGFEPSTLWLQTSCATRLRYTPMKLALIKRKAPCGALVKSRFVSQLFQGAKASQPILGRGRTGSSGKKTEAFMIFFSVGF